MYKSEFLDILKQTLTGEVSPDMIEDNMKYYDQYISTKIAEGNANIVEELGDPRLIAKTIIESERMVQQKGKHTGYQEYQDYDFRTQDRAEGKKKNNGRMFFLNKMKWYHKLMVILTFIIILLILLLIGRFLFVILRLFGIPILFILVLYFLFRKRN